ncbi:MAG: bis(5'-nucleosyl)-tetraphosphatase [Patescibacteria group bacterium]|nr:bis(5'-nucleosyl)-tetraphosphatase [Patescibacteria group bacterium]
MIIINKNKYMPIERSAGAVIFRREGNKVYYLLLYYPSISHRAEKDYWDFPKGHIEKGEKLEETVKREIEEEAGLKDINFIKDFKETIKYFFKFKGKNILKFVTFYLIETKTKEIKISFEHKGYKWLTYPEALKYLSFKNAKEILKKANDFISPR